MKTSAAIGFNFYKGLTIHQRINFKAQWLSVGAYGVVQAWRYVFNESYYGPQYYGSSPFPLAWSDEGCVHSVN